MAGQTPSAKVGVENKTESNQAVAPDVEATPVADQTPVAAEPSPQDDVIPTILLTPPEPGTEVVEYIGVRNEYEGMKGSQRELSLTDFALAGVTKPFTDQRKVAVWTALNRYQLDRKVFTQDALKVLKLQDDFAFTTAE